MDGTFLDSKGQFDMDRLKQVLARFKEKGMYFAVASGRGLLSLEKLFEEVRNEIIFIAENGSLVEFHGEDLYEATMPRDFYLKVFDKLQDLPMSMSTSCFWRANAPAMYWRLWIRLSFLSAHYNENIQKSG